MLDRTVLVLVEIPIKISGGQYYQEPITIYRRSIEKYGEMLRKCNFGVTWETYDGKTQELTDSRIIPYIDLEDRFANMELLRHDRIVLMSFAI